MDVIGPRFVRKSFSIPISRLGYVVILVNVTTMKTASVVVLPGSLIHHAAVLTVGGWSVALVPRYGLAPPCRREEDS